MINVKKSKQQAGQAAAAIIFIENKDRIFKGQKHPHYYLGRQPPLILKFWISCLSSWLIFINFLIIIFYFNKHFICCCESPIPIELKDMHRKVLLGLSSMHWKVLLGVASMHRKVLLGMASMYRKDLLWVASTQIMVLLGVVFHALKESLWGVYNRFFPSKRTSESKIVYWWYWQWCWGWWSCG